MGRKLSSIVKSIKNARKRISNRFTRRRPRTRSLTPQSATPPQQNPLLAIAESRSKSTTRSKSMSRSISVPEEELEKRCTQSINPSLKKFICNKSIDEYVQKMKDSNVGILKRCSLEQHKKRYNDLCSNLAFNEWVKDKKMLYPGISDEDFQIYWKNLSKQDRQSWENISKTILMLERRRALRKRHQKSKSVKSALV